MYIKDVSALSEEDIQQYPVWEFRESTKSDTLITPVLDLPVTNLDNRFVACRFELADGSIVWGTLSNVDLKSQLCTDHFLLMSVFNGGVEFHLDRYFDVTYKKNGPEQLAAFLGKTVKQVFPIRYDISAHATGPREILVGSIPSGPKITLNDEDRMRLLFDRTI